MPKKYPYVEIGRRLADVMGGESRRKFASRIGMPNVATSLPRYESGEREPPSDLLKAIAATCPGVTVEWILTGNGSGPALDAAPRKTPPIPGVALIKRIAARVGAGEGDLADDTLDEAFPLDDEIARSLGHPRVRLRAARVTGDSMEPDLSDGDMVVIAADSEARDGICAVVFDGTVRVKLLQAKLAGRVSIVSLNPKYEPIDAGPEDVRVIGRVVLTIRRR